jgi:hypothetical protein
MRCMVWEAGRSITPTLTTPPAGPSPAVLVHPLPNVASTSKGEKIFLQLPSRDGGIFKEFPGFYLGY